MHIHSTRWVGAAATIVAVMTAYMHAQDPRPFSPEVEDFVAVYLKHGGDKLTNWVQGDKVSRPDEAVRAFKTIDGMTIELVASEPVIRQPIDLHFDDRGRLWVVQYLQYPFPAGLTITSYDQYLPLDTTPFPHPHPTMSAAQTKSPCSRTPMAMARSTLTRMSSQA